MFNAHFFKGTCGRCKDLIHEVSPSRDLQQKAGNGIQSLKNAQSGEGNTVIGQEVGCKWYFDSGLSE